MCHSHDIVLRAKTFHFVSHKSITTILKNFKKVGITAYCLIPKIDYIVVPPVFMNNWLKPNTSAHKYDLKSLKFMFFGGSIVSKQNLQALHTNFPNTIIRQVYGLSEAIRIFQTSDKTQNIESTGFITTDSQAKFVDLSTGKSVGPNQHGEIRVKAPSIMIGYYKNIEATRNAFDEEGWFCTGDIGYYDKNGEVFIVGRMRETFKYKGFQISPAQIEEVLLSHPEIQEAAVIGISHEFDGYVPTAFVEKTPESKVTEKELVEYTLSILEDFKRLRGGIYFMDKLPRTESGKIAKNNLQQLAENLVKSRDNL